MKGHADIDRRRFCGAVATGLVTGPLGLSRLSTRLHTMTDVLPEIEMEAASHEPSIRPFTVHFPDSDLADLKRRIRATRWPDRETVRDSSQGVQLATAQKLATYWATDYDWRKCEAKLNAVPMFKTEIDGLDIHFIHVKSKHPNALALLVTHGWPGSIIEQMKLIGPLTDPTAHGGSAADAFNLVIPSLPGYGFSARPTTTGWGPERISRAWITLMQRLGYTKWVAQGGDWGNAISELMALSKPAGLVAIHTNMPATLPPDVAKAMATGAPAPAGLSQDEQLAFNEARDFLTKHIGYAVEMKTRPQTLYALSDSPIGLATWMIDHDGKSYQLIARVFDGQKEGLTRDDILDNVTLYWLTNTGISSARLYWENTSTAGFFDARGVTLPVAVSVFPDELYPAPESWAKKAYPNLIHYKRFPKGGHFAAWEQPGFMVDELRVSFRQFR